ncbi:MAG: gliding motility-associated C-terminal domain-containing protein [Crocinitomicaceae bacterium]
MRIQFWLLFLFFSVSGLASDLAISSLVTSPVSGCNLTNGELVKITIANADPTAAYIGTFDASYTINGTTVTQSSPSVVMPVGGTINFEFTILADLSGCGIHTIDFNIVVPGDVVLSNNDLTIQITNDCTPTLGSLSGPNSVCEGANSDQIEILGNTGIITDWAYSDNNGVSFNLTGNTTPIETFTNLIVDRIYRVYYDSQFGLCPSDSLSDTIFVDILSVAGVLSSDSVHCDTILPTTAYLNGYNGAVVNYQLSLNAGNSYTTYTNPFDTIQYMEFGPNFQFYAITQNGVCPPDSSNEIFISVLDGPTAGEISGDDTLCAGLNAANLALTGHDGNISDWEFSDDNGVSWSGLGATTSNITISNINSTIDVRVIVEKSPCGTDTAFFNIFIIPGSDAGNLIGNIHYCDTNNTGILSTSGINGTILNWIQSEDNNLTFSSINNTNDSLIYNNIKTSTSFAIIVQHLDCPADTSNFVTVSVGTASQAGEILMDGDSLCPTTIGPGAELSQYSGDVIEWQYSIDSGLNWVSTNITDPLYNQPDIYGACAYRVFVKNGLCDADTAYKYFFVFGPNSDFDNEDTLLLGDSIQLSTPNLSTIFNWTPNIHIDNPTSATPKVSPPINTIYQTSFTDSNGCQTNAIHSIIVIDNPVQISANNFISPNGDGINDTWIIENIQYFPENKVFVFNSYGQMIFEQSPYNNDWDLNSQNLPDGSYFYAIYTDPDSSPIKGSITIINNK